MNVDAYFEIMDKVNHDLKREKLNATCPHCGADILDALTRNAYDWGGYGPPDSTFFECPECKVELEFHLSWETVLEEAELKHE